MTNEQKIDRFHPNVFYTGGGIWIAAMYYDDRYYMTVDNEDMDIFSTYDHSKESQDDDFPCEELHYSENIHDLDETLPEAEDVKRMYTALREALEREMF